MKKLGPHLTVFIICTLSLGWVCGLTIFEFARVVAALCLISLFFFKPRLGDAAESNHFLKIFYWLLIGCCLVFSFSENYLSVRLGHASDDLVIFSQVIHEISSRGVPLTSYLADGWRNYMLHHFVPILYVPAVLTSLGFHAYDAASLLHTVSFAVGVFVFYLALRKIGLKFNLALFVTFLLAINPSMRQGMTFGVHDEVFSFAFYSIAFLGFVSSRPRFVVCGCLAALLCKESLAFVSAIFLLVAFVQFKEKQPLMRGFTSIMFISSIIVCLGFGFSYFLLQPLIFQKSFEHGAKLASLSEFFKMNWLLEKALWTLFLMIPLLFLPLFAPRSCIILLPVAPLIGLIWISRFDEMWKLMNYYAVIPTLFVFFPMALALQHSSRLRILMDSPVFKACLVALAFSWGARKPIKTFFEFRSHPTFSEVSFEMIPRDRVVVAVPGAGIHLLNHKMLLRYYLTKVDGVKCFDFMVVTDEEMQDLARWNLKPIETVGRFRLFENAGSDRCS